MTVSHARSNHGRVVDLGLKRTERVHTLLALREHLAAAYAAYEAHGHDALASQVWHQAAQIAAEIRKLAPRIYEQRWAEWLERDAELMHGPGERRASCLICNLAHAAGLPEAG